MSTIPSWAVKGAKVVYLGRLRKNTARTVQLKKGAIYTIREIYQSPVTGNYGVSVAEVINGLHPVFGLEYGYAIHRFRPVVTLEDDINEHFAVYLKTGHRATERECA